MKNCPGSVSTDPNPPGIIDQNIITLEDVEKLLEVKEEDLNLVMTGKVFPEKLKPYVDAISRIEYIQDLQD